MKSVTFIAKDDVRVVEKPIPNPGYGEVLLRVMACGVCGTDVHIAHGDRGAADCPSGTTLGHEFSGVVEALGEGVCSFSVGDRVAVDPNKLCGECSPCRTGVGHYCEHMVGIGTTVDGGFAEYCAVPASQLVRLSDHVSFAEGAMAEPLSCCLHGIDLSSIRPGDTVAVIGGGMIGLLMLTLAIRSGAATTVLIEPVAEKREMAKALGVTYTIDPFTEDTREKLAALGISRISTVIECVGSTATMKSAIEIAGYASTVMLFGLTSPDAEMPIRPYDLFAREITLRASFINPYTIERANALISAGAVKPLLPIMETIPLSELPAVLFDASRRAKGKIIVDPTR